MSPELTPEERRRIYEEEKARLEARDSLKRSSRSDGYFVWKVIGFAIVLIWIARSCSSVSPDGTSVVDPASKPDPTSASNSLAVPEPRLLITVSYVRFLSDGEVILTGTVSNESAEPLDSPTLRIEVFDAANVLIHTAVAWAGGASARIEPATAARFHTEFHIASGYIRQGVKWRISADRYQFSVKVLDSSEHATYVGD